MNQIVTVELDGRKATAECAVNSNHHRALSDAIALAIQRLDNEQSLGDACYVSGIWNGALVFRVTVTQPE